MLRDEHRLREKIDLSLDERQVAPLALAALLLFAGVFALGVYVGKGLAVQAPQAQPIGNLDALDQRKDAAVAPQRPRSDEAKAASARAADDKSSGAATANAAEAAAKAAEEKAESKRYDEAATKKAAADEAAAKAAIAVQTAAKKEGEARLAEQASRARAISEKATAEKAAKDKAALRAKALAAAAAASGRPGEDGVASVETAEVAGAGAEGDGGEGGEGFTVQIGASPARDDAERLMQRARGAGLKPYLVEANLGDKGTWYRIRVGRFAEKAAAEKFRRDVERELGGRALVMPAR